MVALLQVPTGVHPDVAAGSATVDPAPVVAATPVAAGPPPPVEAARAEAGGGWPRAQAASARARAEVAAAQRLAAIRQCESGGDYMAVSPSGRYRGAYQFARSTWDAVAADADRPDLVGIDPIWAAPADQDALAGHLLERMPGGGLRHWPVCGQGL